MLPNPVGVSQNIPLETKNGREREAAFRTESAFLLEESHQPIRVIILSFKLFTFILVDFIVRPGKNKTHNAGLNNSKFSSFTMFSRRSKGSILNPALRLSFPKILSKE